MLPLARFPSAVPASILHSTSCVTGVVAFARARKALTRGQRRPPVRRTLSGLTRSISQGPDEPPLLRHTIPEHFSQIVSAFGDRPAVICRTATVQGSQRGPFGEGIPEAVETTLNYERLDLLSNHLARSLRSQGVKKGDRVAVSLGNCPEFAVLTYAIFKLGAILVPLNPGFNAKQVTAALTHLEAEVLIVGAVTDLAYKPCRGKPNLALLQELVPDLKSGVIDAPNVPSLRRIIVVDNSPSHPAVASPLASNPSLTAFDNLVRDFDPSSSSSSSRPVAPDSPLSPSDTINIQFTSGTTSHPKAAMLSHTSILNNGAHIANRMGLTSADRIVCPPPLFHCFGCVLGYMATATTGAAILFPSPAFDPVATIRMVADHSATGLYGVATMFIAMLEFADTQLCHTADSDRLVSPEKIRAFPSHLRKGIAAGSSVPESLMRRLYKKLGLEDLVLCYGMTETSPVSCMTSPTDPFEKRTASVGRAMPHTRVKVVDPADRTAVLPIGERGELAAAGYLVMKGYWGDEERTSEVRMWEPDDDGEDGKSTVWMYSGDEASMDQEGYVEITGRIKDLIIRGGENIHPLEIEDCLFQHPLISEVSIVGVPDERYGESVGAFVVAHPGVMVVEDDEETLRTSPGSGNVLTKQEVRDWVRTHLSNHLVPKHVFWVAEFPKTASGKIQKYKLRDLAKAVVAGQE